MAVSGFGVVGNVAVWVLGVKVRGAACSVVDCCFGVSGRGAGLSKTRREPVRGGLVLPSLATHSFGKASPTPTSYSGVSPFISERMLRVNSYENAERN